VFGPFGARGSLKLCYSGEELPPYVGPEFLKDVMRTADSICVPSSWSFGSGRAPEADNKALDKPASQRIAHLRRS